LTGAIGCGTHMPAEPNMSAVGAGPSDSSRKFRILQTCLSPSWGGLEMAALDLSVALKRHGHEVTIACVEGGRMMQAATTKNVPVLALASGKYLRFQNVRRIRGWIRDERVDLIHSHVSGDLPTVVLATKLAGRRVPIVLTKGMGSGIKKTDPFHRFLYANVSRVLAASRFVQRNVVETTPMPESKVVLFFYSIDTDRFFPAHARRAEVRRRFAIGEDIQLIGFVGRFSPGKGHEEFLHAARTLAQKYDSVRFLIVGEASYGEETYAHDIKKLCTTLGLDDRVTFAGYRSDIPDVMAAFDIFAFPSHAESFGIGLIEAMAMERPVVSTRKDGTLDIVVDGETGYFIPVQDAAALATALARLIEQPDLRERMGKAGRRRVMELFSQSGQVRRLEHLYAEICATASSNYGR
jgi:glycosyltransferase involved in cell wall biosynthesis